MSTNRLLQHLRDFIRRQGGGGGVTDSQLLERFVRERDETAFEVLVWRHGPMVLALGQRVLNNPHDAEDVLQATFLTLVRKAGTIGKSESLSSWLYKVAYRIALRSRARAAKMAADSRPIEDVPAADETEESVWRELRPLLDAAIERLPEKYRSAIVLCDLQGKTHREAAEQLGCAVGTISTRVTRARQLLRKRLAHQGPAVTIGVLSAALAQRTTAALPAALAASTIRTAVRLVSEGGAAGIVSASIAELIEGANQAMLMSRFKIVILLALAAGAVAVGVASRAALRHEPPTPPKDPPHAKAAKAPSAKPAEKPANAVKVRGRVLDPKGKPVKDARIYGPRLPKTPPRSEEDVEFPQRAKTDVDGRFRFELPRSEISLEMKFPLIAVADGYGVDWAELPKADVPAELTLRLIKDQPIEGRIVSTEGKPLAGVRVHAMAASKPLQGRLDEFLAGWKQDWRKAIQQHSSPPQAMLMPRDEKSFQAVTDKDGRFRVRGAGSERIVLLRLRGAGVSQAMLWVITRPGFDAAPVNKVVRDGTPPEERRLGRPSLLYGPTIEYVAPASRRIEGTVREAGTGKAVPAFVVHCNVGYDDGVSAVADKEGRYKLEGLPKKNQYLMWAEPPANSSWLRAGARAEDKQGLQPITVDFAVARGILVSGRILDRKTGKGVRGGVRFLPLPGNKFAGKSGYDSYKYESLTNPTDAAGRFQLAVMPGPGVLMAQAGGGSERANGGHKLNPYKQAEFDAKDREHVKITESSDGDRVFTAIDGRPEFLPILNAVKMLDLALDAGTATCDLYLERGTTRTLQIEDADGQPLRGVTVAGVTAWGRRTFTIRDATCTIFALDPKKPRRLVFLHAQRKLAGMLMLRGDEKEPVIVRLGRTGAVKGRVLDRDGQPLAGADINVVVSDPTGFELYREAKQRPTVRTGKDGRFRVEGMVPE
ncbi:MAG: sigma-70 family RNA polymerase sigma factor, partial [Gemmataceae bacterium]